MIQELWFGKKQDVKGLGNQIQDTLCVPLKWVLWEPLPALLGFSVLWQDKIDIGL